MKPTATSTTSTSSSLPHHPAAPQIQVRLPSAAALAPVHTLSCVDAVRELCAVETQRAAETMAALEAANIELPVFEKVAARSIGGGFLGVARAQAGMSVLLSTGTTPYASYAPSYPTSPLLSLIASPTAASSSPTQSSQLDEAGITNAAARAGVGAGSGGLLTATSTGTVSGALVIAARSADDADDAPPPIPSDDISSIDLSLEDSAAVERLHFAPRTVAALSISTAPCDAPFGAPPTLLLSFPAVLEFSSLAYAVPRLTVTAGVPCVGPPAARDAVAALRLALAGVPVNVDAAGAGAGAGTGTGTGNSPGALLTAAATCGTNLARGGGAPIATAIAEATK